MAFELVPATMFDEVALADLFTAGYAEYVVPISIDATRLAWMVGTWDLDLDASRVALDGDTPVGLAMLGLRGHEAWIGGVGVVASMRRRGLGELLMRAELAEAATRGASLVRLEVIRENIGAFALYEKLGFRLVRDLDVWSAPGTASTVNEVPTAAARRTIARRRHVREPWQRADATVDRLDGVVGIASGDGAAVVRVADGRVQLLQAVGSPEELAELVRSASALGDSVHVLNLDPADPLTGALRAAGGRVDVGQYELELVL
jgi:ribosomal protein S18 acetylase RimI-like enzyme